MENAARCVAKSITVITSLIFLYTAATYPFDPFMHGSLFMLLMLLIVFLTKPLKRLRIVDFAFIAFSVITCGHIVVNYVPIAYQAGIPTTTDVVLGTIALILILEATRRVLGLALPILAIIFLLYIFLGAYIPGHWGHGGYSFQYLIGYMYLTLNGIWSFPVWIVSTYIIVFTIFGAFLLHAGADRLFTKLSLVLTRGWRSGPAQVAVVSNALFGTVSGSAPSSVVVTGTFSLPLMTKAGYAKEYCAAVIAVAAAGGLIMPPVMGAGAFLMAGLLGIPYLYIMKAAFLPAVLYFMAIAFSVLFKTRELSQRASPIGPNLDEGESVEIAIKEYVHLLIPLGVLVSLIVWGFSPTRAAFISSVLIVAISLLGKATRMNLYKITKSLEDGSRTVVDVAMACATAAVIYGVVSMTGLGIKLSTFLIELAGRQLLPTLLLVMVVTLILGLGLPATVAYLIGAITTAPALQFFGIPPLAAHLFIFYFSIIGTLTPPVCLAVYTAAALAKSDWLKTAIEAVRIALPSMIIPFSFVITQSLLLEGAVYDILIRFAAAAVGVLSTSLGTAGFCRRKLNAVERVLAIVSGVLLILPIWYFNLIGVAIFMLIVAFQYVPIHRLR